MRRRASSSSSTRLALLSDSELVCAKWSTHTHTHTHIYKIFNSLQASLQNSGVTVLEGVVDALERGVLQQVDELVEMRHGLGGGSRIVVCHTGLALEALLARLSKYSAHVLSVLGHHRWFRRPSTLCIYTHTIEYRVRKQCVHICSVV